MPDKFSKEARSKIMSKIRSKNTAIELVLKKGLKGLYFRYHPKTYGNPDFGISKRKIAIFIDGCFWHKCPKCYIEPQSNKKYWLPKIQKNAERDKKINEHLKKEGWITIRIWEHEIKKNPSRFINKIRKRVMKLI